MGNKKSTPMVIMISLVILIIAGGIFLISRNKQTNQNSYDNEAVMEVPQDIKESEEEQTAEVTFSDGVFAPESLTIKKGTTVLFLNYGNDLMWIASNPHPDHTDLPGLNQGKGGGNGSLYEYTFDQVGTWGYHNHLNSQSTGTIVVEE